MNGKIESFGKEIGDIQENQTEFIKLKNTINGLEISLAGLNSRLEMNLHLNVNELERVIEDFQSEQHTQKYLKNTSQALGP